ncbi:MAG TPA: YoaK family protein [Jatrophihabitantaceae bacterium]
MTGIRSRPETLGMGMLLAAVGGYLDAYTFVQDRVFANAQTGNVVLLAIDLSDRHWHAASTRLVPILAFLLGVIVVEALGLTGVRQRMRHPARIALGSEVALLAILATLPDSTPGWIITTTVSFVAAVQFATFRTLVDTPYTTLLTSGNLRSLVESAHRWLLTRDSDSARHAERFAAVLFAFAAGALVGAVITRHVDVAAAAVPAGLLAVLGTWLMLQTRAIERRAAAATDDADRSTADPRDRTS